MSDPTCCPALLDRCDRCDLLVDLEGFHLVAVARRARGLMLDIESCDWFAGCPGCGVNCTRPRACGGGGDRRALGRGSGKDPLAQTTLDVPQTHLSDGDIPGAQREGMRPRARPGTRAIRQLCFEGATISGLARQLGTTWNTVWSHIKSCLQAAPIVAQRSSLT